MPEPKKNRAGYINASDIRVIFAEAESETEVWRSDATSPQIPLTIMMARTV